MHLTALIHIIVLLERTLAAPIGDQITKLTTEPPQNASTESDYEEIPTKVDSIQEGTFDHPDFERGQLREISTDSPAEEKPSPTKKHHIVKTWNPQFKSRLYQLPFEYQQLFYRSFSSSTTEKSNEKQDEKIKSALGLIQSAILTTSTTAKPPIPNYRSRSRIVGERPLSEPVDPKNATLADSEGEKPVDIYFESNADEKQDGVPKTSNLNLTEIKNNFKNSLDNFLVLIKPNDTNTPSSNDSFPGADSPDFNQTSLDALPADDSAPDLPPSDFAPPASGFSPPPSGGFAPSSAFGPPPPPPQHQPPFLKKGTLVNPLEKAEEIFTLKQKEIEKLEKAKNAPEKNELEILELELNVQRYEKLFYEHLKQVSNNIHQNEHQGGIDPENMLSFIKLMKELNSEKSEKEEKKEKKPKSEQLKSASSSVLFDKLMEMFSIGLVGLMGFVYYDVKKRFGLDKVQLDASPDSVAASLAAKKDNEKKKEEPSTSAADSPAAGPSNEVTSKKE